VWPHVQHFRPKYIVVLPRLVTRISLLLLDAIYIPAPGRSLYPSLRSCRAVSFSPALLRCSCPTLGVPNHSFPVLSEPLLRMADAILHRALDCMWYGTMAGSLTRAKVSTARYERVPLSNGKGYLLFAFQGQGPSGKVPRPWRRCGLARDTELIFGRVRRCFTGRVTLYGLNPASGSPFPSSPSFLQVDRWQGQNGGYSTRDISIRMLPLLHKA
jgi:hypothetical protein